MAILFTFGGSGSEAGWSTVVEVDQPRRFDSAAAHRVSGAQHHRVRSLFGDGPPVEITELRPPGEDPDGVGRLARPGGDGRCR
jgi:hypothetical protein